MLARFKGFKEKYPYYWVSLYFVFYMISHNSNICKHIFVQFAYCYDIIYMLSYNRRNKTGRYKAMLEYEVTYETQNGNHTTINVITSSLIKAARFAESFLSDHVAGYRCLVEVKEHIYD